jgi:Bifunctional DNA primase/polymerase, N-terminal
MSTKPTNSLTRKRPARKSDPDAEQKRLHGAAKRYIAAGIGVIPIRADGSKAPCLPSWKEYQTRLATLAELSQWFEPGVALNPCGIAVVCGDVSGSWEVIDFDEIESAIAWWESINAEHREVSSKLALVLSPRPGLHVHYRCSQIEGPQKLAQRNDSGNDGSKLKTLVETRGQGNYIVVPPSSGSCHPSGRPYERLGDRDLAEVQTITVEERRLLIETARELNEYVRPVRLRPVVQRTNPTTYSGSDRPGDDFNARASWAEILEPHGWRLSYLLHGDTEYWTRPGKADGVSATANYENSGLLYVFSSNAQPFEEQRGYSKFTAYAQLNHGGNFFAAAKELSRRGYGKPVARQVIDALAPYRDLALPRA